MELLPDLPNLSDSELRDLIRKYEKEENEVSYRRRILHGYIDILRAEVVARRKKAGPGAVADIDIDRLTEILATKATPDGADREEEATEHDDEQGAAEKGGP